jgi:cytochrome P450
MPIVSKASRPYIPPFPRRPKKPRSPLSIILALRRNPIEIWCEADFERPVSLGRSILGLRGAAHDPAAIRRIFLDNAANYRKDSALMSRMTLEVLEQTLFSQGLGREPSAFQRAVTGYFDTIGRIDPLDLLGAPRFLPRLGRRRARPALMFFAQAVDDIIESRRALIESGAEAPRDLLTLLLSASDPESGRGVSDEDVRANILTFILAGHETTANALTWTLYLLSQSPEWRERAETEAEEKFDSQRPAATEGCETLRAVLEEAMRLYPPAAMLSRQAIADDQLAGVKIPAGAVISVSPFVLHRRRGLWDNPDAFDPSRFLGERRDRIDRFAYIPFGAGPRVCIGMAFALQEGVILLANLLRAFRFDLVQGQAVMPQQRVTLRPRGGIKMHVKQRGGAQGAAQENFFANVR